MNFCVFFYLPKIICKQNEKQIRKDFFELLREHTEIDRRTHWMDIKKKLEQDSRYKAISDSILREDYFYDYIKILKDERKKKKTEKKKKEKKKKKSKDRSSKDKSENADDDDNASKMSTESNEKKEDDGGEKLMEVDDGKSDDGSDSEKDEEGEHSGTDSETERQRKDRDRQARAEASIKEREREVQRTLADARFERDKERQHHKRDEAVRHFIALLADLVRNADLGWKEAKKQLKKDHRWELVEALDREEKEK